MVRAAQGGAVPPPAVPRVFLISLGERALRSNEILADRLRRAGIAVSLDYEPKSLKSQMRAAGRLAAEQVLIVGDTELDSGRAVLKNMADGTQREISFSDLEAML